MNKPSSVKEAIGATVIILVVSAVVLSFGTMTLRSWDAGDWWKLVLAATATLGTFAVLVSVVKYLLDRSVGD